MNFTIRTQNDIDFAINLLKKLSLATKLGKAITHYFECIKMGAKRSISQNKYMWFVNAYYGDEKGYLPAEMHYDVLSKIRQIEKTGKDGVIRTVTLETKKMSTIEFEKYMEKIRFLALKFDDFTIPKPNEIPEELYRKYHKNYVPNV